MIAAVNQNEGVGECPTAYNFGVELTGKGELVLLVDINVEPQRNPTKMLGERRLYDMPLTLSDVLNYIVVNIHKDAGTIKFCITVRTLTLFPSTAPCLLLR